MKRLLMFVFACLSFVAVANARSRGYTWGNEGTGSNYESERVNGYYRQNGTYVESYNRTRANSTDDDNYSTKGNYNPYTGKYGTNKNKSDYGW